MDHLSEDLQSQNIAHAYGFTWWMKAIYLFAAALTLYFAVFLFTNSAGAGTAERIWRLIEAGAFALSGIYFLASALLSCVLVDDYSVNVRGVFFTSSLFKHEIHWFSRGATPWIPCTILYTDEPEMKKLTIVHCFNFDSDWHHWIAGLKQLPS